MTVPSHFHMPGAFHGEGVHPGLFRPPLSSSPSSSTYGFRPQVRTASFETHAKRKRHEISRSQEQPFDGDVDGDNFFTTPTTARPEDKRYYLAGQLDTPFGAPVEEGGGLGESMYSDSDYRRALGSKRARDDMMELDANGPTPLFNLPPQPIPYQGWGAFAFNAIGGVVGRVWEFCRTGAFKGFQAGGGRKFEVTQNGVEEVPSLFGGQVDEQHIPGGYPQADCHMDDRDCNRESTPSRPAAKRRHTEHQDDLGRNWVMVDSSERRASLRRPVRAVPRSRNHGPSMATGRRITQSTARLSSSVASHTGRSSSIRPPPTPTPAYEPPLPSSSASFASPRSAHQPTPSKIPQPVANGSHRRRSSLAPSPSQVSLHRRSQSNASAASSRGGSANEMVVDASPRLDAEAKQLAARRKMEERDADVRIAAFNKRLQDMIRQGKEALGTTVEVEGTWEDED